MNLFLFLFFRLTNVFAPDPVHNWVERNKLTRFLFSISSALLISALVSINERKRERERAKGVEEENSNLYEKIHIEVFVCAPYKNVYLSTPRVSVGPRDDQRGIIILKLTPG